MKIVRFMILSVLSLAICGCLNLNNRTHAAQLKYDLKNVNFDQNTFDCVILGGGIGGLTSSIYIARSGYSPVIIQGEIPGGLITQSTEVENWPGEIKISGQELANKIRNQAINHGVKILQGRVGGVDFQKWPYVIYLKSLDSQSVTEIKALTCIITMGTTPNLLQVQGESGPDGYFGHGISTCAVCDGNLYKDKIVAVVGGGDSAATEALYLSKIAKKVYMLVRGDKLRANFANQQGIKSKSNIEILLETKVTKINGNGQKIASISIFDKKSDVEKNIEIDCLFLAIGSTPNSESFKDQLSLDEKGYIKLFNYQETSRKGVFAAGDISDPKFKQAVTAAGDSAKASLQAIEFLSNIGHLPKSSLIKKTGAGANQSQVIPIAKIPETKSITEEKNSVINIESEVHFKHILSKSKFVIADFYGDFCIPCQQMLPIFNKVAQDFVDEVVFVKVNVEKNSVLAQKNKVSGVPTFIIFKDGQPVKRFSGTRGDNRLKQEIIEVMD
ncbi:MAG: FAD-dependent oxidoreductase [bacterium]